MPAFHPRRLISNCGKYPFEINLVLHFASILLYLSYKVICGRNASVGNSYTKLIEGTLKKAIEGGRGIALWEFVDFLFVTFDVTVVLLNLFYFTYIRDNVWVRVQD